MRVKNVLKWALKLKSLFCCFVLFVFIQLHSQDLVHKQLNPVYSQSIYFTQSFQKFDNFSMLNWLVKRNKIIFDVSFGVGLNRTFYQKRFFPQAQIGFGYSVFSFRNCELSPEFNVGFSSFSSIERHYFSSFKVGYFFQFGKKFLLIHRLNGGLLNERFINSLDKITSANTIDWQFSLGIGYAFN
jgi:hypothetical protein